MKTISKMTYFVSSGMYNLNSVNQSRHNDTNVPVFDVTDFACPQHNIMSINVLSNITAFLSKGNRDCNIHTAVLQRRCLLDVFIYALHSIVH